MDASAGFAKRRVLKLLAGKMSKRVRSVVIEVGVLVAVFSCDRDPVRPAVDGGTASPAHGVGGQSSGGTPPSGDDFSDLVPTDDGPAPIACPALDGAPGMTFEARGRSDCSGWLDPDLCFSLSDTHASASIAVVLLPLDGGGSGGANGHGGAMGGEGGLGGASAVHMPFPLPVKVGAVAAGRANYRVSIPLNDEAIDPYLTGQQPIPYGYYGTFSGRLALLVGSEKKAEAQLTVLPAFDDCIVE